MSSKGGGTQGYRYYMSLLSGLCRTADAVVEIKIGDKTAWTGSQCGCGGYINKPELFGGDDKEGGIQGPFCVFLGEDDQVLPGPQGGLPGVRESIGGLVSQMRGVTTVWFHGLVAAMNPYLKTWKFRVRRTRGGWFNDDVWYPAKAAIYLGAESLSVSTNREIDFPISFDDQAATYTIAFSRNVQEGDTITINGQTITYVDDDDPGDYEIKPNSNRARSVRNLANYVNGRSTELKATATYTDTTVTLTALKGGGNQIFAMNPAHMIYQCYTDPLWGRGFRSLDMGENSFVYAANKLCDEGFGLALIWYRKEEIETFIQKICDLIGAITYTNRETGLTDIKLIRDDYDPDELPLFTPETGLLAITDDDSASSDNSYNEIIGTSRDPVTNLDFQMRAQNLAALQSQGAISSLDQDYKGIPTKQLLARVVTRDLRAMASGLKKYNLTLDRRAWRLTPGSVIKVSHPGRGLANVILRIVDIDDGNMVNGEIKVKAAIDVFGLPSTTYVDVVDNGWVAPSKVAVPAADERLVEASYRDLYRRVGASEAAAAEPTSAYIGQLALAPSATILEYDLTTKAEGEPEYVDRARGNFTGNALLAAALGPLDTTATIKSPKMFDEDNVGEAILIDDELVRLDAIEDDEITITRGVGDTIPAAHAVNAVLWTIDDDLVSDGVAYTDGETVFAKVLTRTSEQLLDEDNAEEQEIKLVGRHALPYPPAAVQIAGISVYGPVGEQDEPVLTWVERNRITQADTLVGHEEASIAAEPDTTYTIRIYDNVGNLLRTVEDIADTTWTYTNVMQDEDTPTSVVYAELEAVRNGMASYQHYRFPIVLNGGWGYGWGTNWGGA